MPSFRLTVRTRTRSAWGSSPVGSYPFSGADPLLERVRGLRTASFVVLTGLLLNAGLAVLLVAAASNSVVAGLGTLAVAAAIIILAALFAETFLLRAGGARPMLPGEYPWLKP